ncbi:hypothetical protein GCM10009817_14950 [Terrabacter lapilli]|uniref:DUF1990 domain-containing protein n=1 Tax=Terrabacter lapilli TaxID=436231 RepID=A0ABN2RW16_9MICO
MTVRSLSPEQSAVLRAAPLTYPRGAMEGSARDGTPPPAGYRHFEESVRLRRRDFGGAARDLLGWRVHDRAGLRVHASGTAGHFDTVVELHLGVGPLGVRIPCRVVDVIDEPDRTGFAYGTLPGHPESGEERFVLDREPDGSIVFTISAFSRHATLLARLGGPVSRVVQDGMTRRYLRALDRL